MPIVIDTSVWSLGLRRTRKDLAPNQRALVLHFKQIISSGHAVMPGVVRQEILTGIDDEGRFEEMSRYLRAFDNPNVDTDDYERAAQFANLCIASGVAATLADMLICAFANGRDWPILTTDNDFIRYATHIPIRLYLLP